MTLSRRRWFYALAWLLALVVLPWWLGLPLLLAIAAALLFAAERLERHAPVLRLALRWGLPGVLLALQRGLGGDAFAWAMALLGALAGFTLLAGLEAWLDRGRREKVAQPELRDWPSLALAPIGPAVAVVELRPPEWSEGVCPDPLGGEAHWQAGCFVLPDGATVERVQPRAAFSPDGRWFVARTSRGVVLVDRDHRRSHRLRGWELCGWHEGPWFVSGSGPAMAWREVLGQH
ncbi:hypothetical protein [Frateuria sp. STR12]|uniref:hypothetical protein n=1 Tax=Frateuria hangzhouensis TaxID=2995589 RepID=UPI002260E7B8|nr:hypothetical protein [Frateuria sp. STR12]MCX7512980.1 hypothetical protein [Frateuria sp. STR12]